MQWQKPIIVRLQLDRGQEETNQPVQNQAQTRHQEVYKLGHRAKWKATIKNSTLIEKGLGRSQHPKVRVEFEENWGFTTSGVFSRTVEELYGICKGYLKEKT